MSIYDIERGYEEGFREGAKDALAERRQWKRVPIAQQGWAVIDSDGEIMDVYMHKVTRDNLVLHDAERIIEVWITPQK